MPSMQTLGGTRITDLPKRIVAAYTPILENRLRPKIPGCHSTTKNCHDNSGSVACSCRNCTGLIFISHKETLRNSRPRYSSFSNPSVFGILGMGGCHLSAAIKLSPCLPRLRREAAQRSAVLEAGGQKETAAACSLPVSAHSFFDFDRGTTMTTTSTRLRAGSRRLRG